MSVSVTLPALGESVTEGTVTRWLKQVGESVDADEPLLEVSTDKVDTEIPSPAAGTLLSITAAEDETVEVGAELGVIGESSDAPAAADDGSGSGSDGTPPPGDRGTAEDPARAEPAASGHSTASEVPGGQSGSLPAADAAPAGAQADSHADQMRDAAGAAPAEPSGTAAAPAPVPAPAPRQTPPPAAAEAGSPA